MKLWHTLLLGLISLNIGLGLVLPIVTKKHDFFNVVRAEEPPEQINGKTVVDTNYGINFIDYTFDDGSHLQTIYSSTVYTHENDGWKTLPQCSNINWETDWFNFTYRNYWIQIQPLIWHNNNNNYSISDIKTLYPSVSISDYVTFKKFNHKFSVNFSNIPPTLLNNVNAIVLKLRDAGGLTWNDIETRFECCKSIVIKDKIELCYQDLLDSGYTLELRDKRTLIIGDIQSVAQSGSFNLDPSIQLQTADTENLDDTFIEEDQPTYERGSCTYLELQNSTGVLKYREEPLLKFNLTNVTDGSTITNSTLFLYYYDETMDTQEQMNIYNHHVYDRNWTEGNACPAVATGNELCYNTKPTSSEHNTTYEDSYHWTDTGGSNFGWISWNCTQMTQRDIDNSYDNLSIWMKGVYALREHEISDYILFYSKEYAGDTSLRPYLNITYTEPATGPPFYFDSQNSSEWTNPDNMVDNSLSTFAHTTTNGDLQRCNSTNYTSGDFGTIKYVYLHPYGNSTEGAFGSQNIWMTPNFDGTNGSVYQQASDWDATPSWRESKDITNDTNGPGYGNWEYSDIDTLDCWVQAILSGLGTPAVSVYKIAVNLTIGDTDNVPPIINITFAGNPGDTGGPLYLPPHESGDEAPDGYYTNNSWQTETFINITCNITDADSNVDEAYVHLYNQTESWWDNTSYQMSSWTEGGSKPNQYTVNITSLTANHTYSFNIWANDTLNNINTTFWNKTGLNSNIVRRYVKLGCTTTNFSYLPFYLQENTNNSGLYWSADLNTPDRLMFDGGPDGTTPDTGYLSHYNASILDDTVHDRRCASFTGYWWDDSISSYDFSIDNIYYHVWFTNNASNDQINFSWHKTRDDCRNGHIDRTSFDKTNERSNIFYDHGYTGFNKNFSLGTLLQTTTPTSFTDNDIYEFVLRFRWNVSSPVTIHNRSFMSFILFNVPSNATLNASHPDTDSDGLSDWYELYQSYTSPWHSDTDNDGASDYYEIITGGTDPNNWSDVNIRIWTQTTTWNNSFSHTADWTQTQSWNNSFSHTADYQQTTTWNNSFSNTSNNQQTMTWNNSFSHTANQQQTYTWNNSFSNTTNLRQTFTFNNSFSHTVQYQQTHTWNNSFSNTSTYYQTFTFNNSFSNTSTYQQSFTWNNSFSHTAEYQQTFTFNNSFSNTTEYQQCFTWNNSFSHLADYQQTMTWNNSFSSTADLQQTFTFNTSFSNTSLFQQQYTWNNSFSNSTNYQQTMTWNNSFSHLADYQQTMTFNNSFSHTALYQQTMTWNNSFSHTANTQQTMTWNNSFSNTSNNQQTMTWNNSFGHIANYQQTQSWNNSFSNTSHYYQRFTFNNSFSNTSSHYQCFTWNNSFSHSANQQQIQTWNNSFSNTSTTSQTFTWNNSFSHTADYQQTQSFNNSFSNTSTHYQTMTWNNSFSHTPTWTQTTTFNNSFSNTAQHYQTTTWNNSFSNTTTDQQCYSWNNSFRHTANQQQTYTWNNSFSNTSDYQQCFTFNNSFSNTTHHRQTYTWNNSFSNTSIRNWNQTTTWNNSFSNTSQHYQTYTFNNSFSHTATLQQTTTWNNSFSHTANTQQTMTYNNSFSNTSNQYQTFTWNNSFSHAADYQQTQSWNNSFSNTSNNYQTFTWNNSFSHTPTWTQTTTFNNSFSNTTSYRQCSSWNNSFSHTANQQQTYTWNNSFSHTATLQQTMIWNNSFSNTSSITQTFTFNNSFSNTSHYRQTVTWNNSFGNIPSWQQTTTWNNSFSNTMNQTFTWNNSFSNTSLGIYITLPYPINQSTGHIFNETLHILANHTQGDIFNITFYIGNSSENTTIILGYINLTTNGTHYMTTASLPTNNSDTMYWWRVNASDGKGNYSQHRFWYNTSILGRDVIPLVQQNRNTLMLVLGVSVGLVLGIIWIRRRKKKNNRGNQYGY